MDRVLVIRLGRIGDMVMITPALRAILIKYPEDEVHLLTSPEGQHVLRGFDPRLASPLVYDRRGLGQMFRWRRLGRTLAASGYRRIYCFETNPSYRRLLAGVPGEKHVLGPVDGIVPFPERCLRLVGVQPSPATRVSLPLTEAGRATASAMLAAAGIDGTDFLVGLHPTFSTLSKLRFRGREARRRKTWPLASFARLAMLLKQYGEHRGLKLRIVSVLLPADHARGRELVERSQGAVTLLAGSTDFERYKAMIARMNLLIAPDTGPMHIAAAVGTPVVALFSGRHPRDCGPYTDAARYAVLRAEDTERPELALAAIAPQAVFEACRRFLPA